MGVLLKLFLNVLAQNTLEVYIYIATGTVKRSNSLITKKKRFHDMLFMFNTFFFLREEMLVLY